MQSEDIDFSLSFKNIEDIPFNKYDKNFTFIVDGHKYETSRIVADLLSPIIKNMHFNDESNEEYYLNTNIKTNNKSDDDDYFQKFLELVKFEKRPLTKDERAHFSEYFYKLGNITEYLRICKGRFIHDINTTNVISRLKEISDLTDNNNTNNFDINEIEEIEELIKFTSANFENINKEEMKELKYCIIEEIINNEELKLQTGDSLIEFIIELYQEDRKYCRLFDYVLFKNLSYEALCKFVEIFDIETIDKEIWKSICSLFINKENENNEQNNKEKERYLDKSKEFKYSKDKPFEGILRYLTKKTGSNIHDNGTIEITSNSINGSCHPKRLVDYESESDYDSLNDGGAYVCFDFKDNQIQLTDYTMESYGAGPNDCHLKNWNIEVSNDGKKWKTIDERKDDPTLNGSKIVGSFQIQKPDNEFYRFVRLHQTGNSWNSSGNHNRFYFYFMEFYGKFKEPAE